MRPDQRRIEYSGSVHDEEEIEAVVEVLRGGPSALRISKNVKAFEQGVAEYFGKRRGIMVNSGSSALYLAVELLGCEPGDEVITSSVTFSTDIAPLVRAGLVPAFVDVEPDTFNIDVDGIEAMISPRTKAILVPNLIGNCPDWDRIRAIADAHGLKVIEDSCDALGAKLRGTPTGTRSDISVTSFALAHVITAAATGGMVLLDDDDLVDRCVLLRRWGRRSETQFYGSKKGDKRFFTEVDGIEYDNLFIFDEVGWNFEPCEISAAFGVVQLRKLPRQPRPPSAQLRAAVGVLRQLPRRVRAAAPDGRARDRVAHVPGPHPARVGDPPGGVPGAHGGSRRGHADGVDRQRDPPAGVREGAAPGAGGRSAQRRPGDGAGTHPAAEPRARRRRHRVPLRDRRTLPAGARPRLRGSASS